METFFVLLWSSPSVAPIGWAVDGGLGIQPSRSTGVLVSGIVWSVGSEREAGEFSAGVIQEEVYELGNTDDNQLDPHLGDLHTLDNGRMKYERERSEREGTSFGSRFPARAPFRCNLDQVLLDSANLLEP